MRNIIVLAGLPRSGKTSWCKKQIAAIGDTAVLVDNPSQNSEEWENVKPEHEYVFVCDPYFCLMAPEKIRSMLEENLGVDLKGVALRWACMENDLRCIENADDRTQRFAQRISKSFRIPDQAQIIPMDGPQSPWWTIPQSVLFN